MSSPRRPTDQLEPSNLLEPLDLGDHWNLEGSSAAADWDATSRPSRINAPPPAQRRGWGALKAALILTSAVICFAAGAAASKFAMLSFGARQPTLTSSARPSAPAVITPSQSVDSKPVESKPSQRAETKANQPSAATSDESAAAANAGTPAASPQRENAASQQGENTAAATPWIDPPSGPQTTGGTDGRAANSGSGAAPPSIANPPSAAASPATSSTSEAGNSSARKRAITTTSRASSASEPTGRDGNAEPGASPRGETRTSSRQNDTRTTSRRERGTSHQARRAIERDGAEQGRSSDERRWERDGDQGWGWGRERGDGYSREYSRDDGRRYSGDDSRRAFGRGSREETFGRSVREEERVTARGARDRNRMIERESATSRSPRDDGGFFGLFRNDR